MEPIKNEKLLELINSYRQNKTVENLNIVITELVKCTVLIPAQLVDKKPYPSLMKTAEGDRFLGMYSDKEQIPENLRDGALIAVPFIIANKMAINPIDNIKGIVVNPYTDNFIMQRPLLDRIEEVENGKKNAPNTPSGIESLGQVVTDENGNRSLMMNESQYNQFERTQFEISYIPTQLFSKGQDFIDRLISDKENYIDEMYEESYKEKRMYPYLPEDFSVMPITLNDDYLLIRVDMPEKEVLFGNAYRVYISWNNKTLEARYFRIVQGKTKKQIIFEEVDKNKKVTQMGDAPAEGTEIKAISDLIGIEL